MYHANPFLDSLALTPSLPNSLTSIFSPTLPDWHYLTKRFQNFIEKIEPTTSQQEDVFTKAAGILSCLNNRYWDGQIVGEATSLVLAGSWAKGTRARLSSDLDMIFLLPWHVYSRFENRQGNKQSAILQEVKETLQASYPDTFIRSDGPTVILDFYTYKVEVAPAFRDPNSPALIYDQNFKVWLCETAQQGRYKLAAPAAERNQIIRLNDLWNGDLIALIRMAKTWKRHCNVPIKSFKIEQLAIGFLSQWNNTGKQIFWYDWMMRDFFEFMLSRKNGVGSLPISNEIFFYGDEWVSRTETALRNARNACIYEKMNFNELAGESWQKIFGYNIPKVAS